MYAQVQMINNANTKTPSKEYTEKKEKKISEIRNEIMGKRLVTKN